MNLAWILKFKKEFPNTYIPAKKLLNIHKRLIVNLYEDIYIPCFGCFTLPAWRYCYCAFCCLLHYCFYFLRGILTSWTWEGLGQCCMWILDQPFLPPAMFAKNYTSQNASHFVNKDNPVAIAEEKKSRVLFFASIWQQRNIRKWFFFPRLLSTMILLFTSKKIVQVGHSCVPWTTERGHETSWPHIAIKPTQSEATDSDLSKADFGSL